MEIPFLVRVSSTLHDLTVFEIPFDSVRKIVGYSDSEKD